MRNLSTGGLAYLSALRGSNPSIGAVHKHIHTNKRSLSIVKKSYLLTIAFQLMQLLGSFPYLFYPIWGDGIFSCWPLGVVKDKFFATILSSSKHVGQHTLREAESVR
jgi:hypothetical protein